MHLCFAWRLFICVAERRRHFLVIQPEVLVQFSIVKYAAEIALSHVFLLLLFLIIEHIIICDIIYSQILVLTRVLVDVGQLVSMQRILAQVDGFSQLTFMHFLVVFWLWFVYYL